MLNVEKISNGKELTVKLAGRLDTTTAPTLDSKLRTAGNGIEKLVFDISALEYISSAGLRVLLSAQKMMNKQGEMVVRGANETVRDIFEVTGFIDVLNIE